MRQQHTVPDVSRGVARALVMRHQENVVGAACGTVYSTAVAVHMCTVQACSSTVVGTTGVCAAAAPCVLRASRDNDGVCCAAPALVCSLLVRQKRLEPWHVSYKACT